MIALIGSIAALVAVIGVLVMVGIATDEDSEDWESEFVANAW